MGGHEGVWAKLYTQTFSMDVVLLVEGDERKIEAHRNVLMAASDYFQSLFKDHFQEQPNAKEFTLKEICFDTLQMLVEFIYTGKLDFEKCTVHQALKTADYLMLDCAIRSLNEHVSNNVTKENCFKMYEAFEILGEDVRDQLEAFIRENIKDLLKRAEFLSLSFKQLENILKNPGPIENLNDVYAVVEWVSENLNERSQYVRQLLPLVVFKVDPGRKLNMAYYYDYLMPLCKCTESKDFFIAFIAKAHGKTHKFINRFFNEKNWKC